MPTENRTERRLVNSRHMFSIIEVVLAVCILGIGLVYIMRLYGTGLRSARDSVARKFTADSVDHFLHSYALQLKDPTGDFRNWNTMGLALPSAKPGASEPANWTVWQNDGCTKSWRGPSGSTDIVRIAQCSNGAEIPDFEAVYRIWRDTVKYWKYDGATWQEINVPPDQALALNVEVSWPIVAPYENRQKSLFRFEVFRGPR